MSKNKTTPNPHRPRSKSSPDGKRNGPQTDWPTYNKGHRFEGRRYAKWFPKVADRARGGDPARGRPISDARGHVAP